MKHPPQQVFTAGQRIEDLTDDSQGRGTVTKISPSGYVYVVLDSDPDRRIMLTPARAHKILRKCQPGDDSLARHEWDTALTTVNPSCAWCGEVQSDENEFASCKAAGTVS